MNIVELLEHPWLIKFNSKIGDIRKKNKETGRCTFDIYSSVDK
jgi:hypothetical protein